jgi:hypothetical protein
MKLFTILCAVVLLVSCGGGKSGLNKDTKADYQLDQKTLDSLGRSEDNAVRKSYMDKVIEIKGIIKSVEKSVSSASPNKYSFYLCSTATDQDTDCAICYTDEDLSASVGKTVTVKGNFDYAGAVTINNCVAY